MRSVTFYFSQRTFLLHGDDGDIKTAVKMVLIPQSYSTKRYEYSDQRVSVRIAGYVVQYLYFSFYTVTDLCRDIITEYSTPHPPLHRNTLCAGIFKQSMGPRNRVGIELSRPAKLHSLAELVLWNRFLGSLKV